MVSKHEGVCSACKQAFPEGARIVIKQVGSRLNARHEGCKDAVPVQSVTRVEDNVYRVARPKTGQDAERDRSTRSFDPAAKSRT